MGDRGRDGREGGFVRSAVVSAAVLALAACGGSSKHAAVAPPRADAQTGFLAPPTLSSAARRADGGVRLSGRAPPDAIVRLQSPDGRALGVTADAAGGWTLEPPPAATPALYALFAELDGRILRGEGALAVAPLGVAGAALVARAGAPAVVAASGTPPTAPQLQAVDFDGGGGLAAAGRAAPGEAMKLLVDGTEIGEGVADGAGRFGLAGVRAPLALGPHRLRVESAAGAAEAAVDTSAPAALGGSPFRAARAAGGWRIDWSPPGGGVQSFLWLDGPTR